MKFASRRAELASCLAAFGAAFALSFLTRTIPFPQGDQGVFQSVAYRLLAGDRLYVDVYDNKDPLFYYLTVAEVRGGPFFQYFAETIAILGTGYLVAITARRFQPQISPTMFTSCWLAAAYIFTGLFWWPGLPGTPGAFLAQGAITAIIFDLPMLTGFALAATLFTDIIFFPPAASFVLLFCLLRREGCRSVPRTLAIIFSAGAGGVLAVAMLLLLRGELAAYFGMLARNFLYTRENWQPIGGLAVTARNHLVATLYFGRSVLPVWVLSAVLLVHFGRQSPPGSAYRSACLAAALLFPVLLVESVGIVFLEQHLGPWKLLVFLALALAVPKLLKQSRQWLAVPALGFAMLTLIPLSWEELAGNPFHFELGLRRLTELSPETRLLKAMAGNHSASYARLATNNDFHHALGTERYRLACPDFHQYDITSVELLQANLRCALSADYVIVNLPPYQLRPQDTWLPPYSRIEQFNARWLAYRRLVHRSISHGYTCLRDGPDLHVCRKLP